VNATAGVEVSKDIGEFLIPHTKLTTKLVLTAWSGPERDEDAFAQGCYIVGGVFKDHFEPNGSFFGHESQAERRSWGGETMLAGEDEVPASRTQVEIGIAPGVEVGATSEVETWFVGGVFACVVDEDDGEAESSREFPQGGEHGRDFGGVILVDALKPDVRVQDKKFWAVSSEGESKSVEMLDTVEPERGLEDELHVERVEVRSPRTSDALNAFADLFRSILGGIDEDPTGLRDFEAIETGSARSHGDGDFESEPCLARFRRSTDDADGAVTPQPNDEPQGLFESAFL
jgi:hypothetical protein